MIKIAVFVEGQAELIFVRHLLLRHFDWNVNINCLRLYKKGQYEACNYPNKVPESPFHYNIYNVGCDASVISEIILHEAKLIEQGFDKIIGIRDMFSEAYRSESDVIDSDLNIKFITGHQETIRKMAKFPEKIFFNFSIMEIEAWWLGLYTVFERIHPNLTLEFIRKNTNLDLGLNDPELFHYHPAQIYKSILSCVGLEYSKKETEVEQFCSKILKEEFHNLFVSSNCASFSHFFSNLELNVA